MPRPIETFLNTLDQHSAESIPTWLTAAVTRLIFDFSQPAELLMKPNAQALENFPEINGGEGMVRMDLDGSAVEIDPIEPIDINVILKFRGMSEPSATSPMELLQRSAGIIRVLARVLALKNTGDSDKEAIGKAILWITDLANHLRDLGGGEVDFRSVGINILFDAPQSVSPGSAASAAAPSVRVNNTRRGPRQPKTPEERAMCSVRMKQAWARRKAREKQEAFHRHDVERSQPLPDGETFRGTAAVGSPAASQQQGSDSAAA